MLGRRHGVLGQRRVERNPEYRWEYIHIGQGHYFLAKNDEEALRLAASEAYVRRLDDAIRVEGWKPRGRVYIVRPGNMKGFNTQEISTYYGARGYDRDLIFKRLNESDNMVDVDKLGIGTWDVVFRDDEMWSRAMSFMLLNRLYHMLDDAREGEAANEVNRIQKDISKRLPPGTIDRLTDISHSIVLPPIR